MPGDWFNITMSYYSYKNFHCGDKTNLRPSYFNNGISYTDKTTSLYGICALYSIYACVYLKRSIIIPFHWQGLWIGKALPKMKRRDASSPIDESLVETQKNIRQISENQKWKVGYCCA